MQTNGLSENLMNRETMNWMLTDIGAPFVIGLAVGYFAKKMLKIVLFLAGMAIVRLFVAEYYNVIELNNDGLKTAAENATNLTKHSGNFLLDRLSQITAATGLSAATGFFVGLKIG